jgi:3-deoxy-D-manno-oct-2-ulosonic acid (Kdo) hydroxylase
VPVVPRSAYDEFMLRFHDYLNRNEEFQSGKTYRFELPPGSTWLAFTDVLPHSVQSGQYASERTFIAARESMAKPSDAPIEILERLCGKPLAAQPA